MGVFNASGMDPNFNYYFKICTGGANPNSRLCNFTSQGFQYSSLYELCYPIGATNPRISFINPSSEQEGVSIVHSEIVASDGVLRKLKINLVCDYALETPKFTFMSESKEGGVITYLFSGRTKYSCPPKPKVVDCTIKTTSGVVLDLSVLDQSNGYVVSSTNDPSWNYYFTETCTTTSQAYQYSKTYNVCFPIGYGANPILSFVNPAKEREGVKVVHSEIYNTDGVARKLELRLYCDRNAQTLPTFQFIGETREGGVITYQFSGKTKSVCPALPEIPKQWGGLNYIDLDDYSNRIVSYRLDSFIGQPTLNVQVLPSSSIQKYLFMISDCTKNSWSSTFKFDNSSFLQNYGCVSIFSQVSNETNPVPLSISFTQPSSEMMLVIQTSTNQEMVNMGNTNSYTVQPSSVRYNLIYSRKIMYNYKELKLNEELSISQKDSELYLATVKFPANSYLKLNCYQIKDIYVSKEVAWNTAQEIVSSDYHLTKSGVLYIYSGETQVEYKLVIIGNAYLYTSVVDFVYTSNTVTGLSLSLAASIFILALVIVIGIVVIIKLRQKQNNLGDLKVRLN
ncbi:predicted protein [Naegleria gruberi]|uniref:Predicted protein n=1 Tax=Naegleria gruberi TaxID=5762 RepID=D2VDE7_NAEGR|nr:uncharacterized protein NAEGRDRAFT_66816 [Naegleria gruberi]EFC45130.1 predicted protein [Naegleria gruberi]|eukprot:XP_002677874.1 predicted protein [Naegleria gruberi strain NEG-M]